MQDLRTELATLIASRICHDLISPVGAISNGLELVALGGDLSGGPELQLISESCDNANARIRFFRVAFGAARDGARMATSEVKSILAALTRGSRLEVVWDSAEDLPRADVQLAFLALQCIETALIRGGTVTISSEAGQLHLSAAAERVTCDPHLWHHLTQRVTGAGVLGSGTGVAPAHVQFVLMPLLAADQGRTITTSNTETSITLTV